jgi:subfamily B ATP-binding cassette protein MsbA
MRGRTTLVIAHRLSTVQGADLICVVERGHVVEIGRHAELIARDALYARLHAMQFAEERDLAEAAPRAVTA